MPLSLSERLQARTVTQGDCLLWTGYVSPGGYAYIKYQGVMMGVHRAVWLDFYGSLPPAGIVLDHRCSNRTCVNLDHLRPATPKENMEHRKGANKNSRSGIRGVSIRPDGKFYARLCHGRKKIWVGVFDTAEEAASAVDLKRRELYTLAV